jgi:hypothetical protein
MYHTHTNLLGNFEHNQQLLRPNTSLTPPPFIDMPLSSRGSEQSCIFALRGIDVGFVSTIYFLQLDCGNEPTVCFFRFI